MLKLIEMTRALGTPVTERTVGDPAMPATVTRWRHGRATIPITADGTAHLVLGLSSGEQAKYLTQGQRTSNQTVIGAVGVMPYGKESITDIGPSDAFHIFLPAAMLEQAAEYRPPSIRDNLGASPGIRRNVLEIFVATNQPDPDVELRLDHSIFSLAHALATESKEAARAHPTGGLTPIVKRRINDLIESRISRDDAAPLTLTEMATAAGLSVGHFSRMFRVETGTTPYLYASKRRLDRAMTLLSKPVMSIGEAADSTGFSSPSHFVAAFRRHLGVTPGAFRNAVTT